MVGTDGNAQQMRRGAWESMRRNAVSYAELMGRFCTDESKAQINEALQDFMDIPEPTNVKEFDDVTERKTKFSFLVRQIAASDLEKNS